MAHAALRRLTMLPLPGAANADAVGAPSHAAPAGAAAARLQQLQRLSMLQSRLSMAAAGGDLLGSQAGHAAATGRRSMAADVSRRASRPGAARASLLAATQPAPQHAGRGRQASLAGPASAQAEADVLTAELGALRCDSPVGDYAAGGSPDLPVNELDLTGD
jgi:hypothetical protein